MGTGGLRLLRRPLYRSAPARRHPHDVRRELRHGQALDGALRTLPAILSAPRPMPPAATRWCNILPMESEPGTIEILEAPKKPRRLTSFASVRQPLLDAIAQGVPNRTACRAAGVPEGTFYLWLKSKPGFHADVEQAEAKGETFAIDIIRKAMPHSWQAAAWFLERRYPDRYGLRAKIDLESLIRADAARLGYDAEAAIDAAEQLVRASAAG